MISTIQKLGLGAIGALCLGLLKLINANFYLGTTTSNVALGAYLTYGAYLILGMAVGTLFCEQFPTDANKTRKSAFLMGLLAPSILIAIITKPIGGDNEGGGKTQGIPSLPTTMVDFFVSSAYAQSPTPTATAAPTVTVITKSDVVPGLGAGIKSALGAQTAIQDSLFVVGKSNNETEAVKTAEQINALFKKGNEHDLKAQVIKPQGGNEVFVTIGNITSATGAAETQTKAKEAAVKALTGSTLVPTEQATAKTLLGGNVYKSEALFPK